jgi:hypothetical protein
MLGLVGQLIYCMYSIAKPCNVIHIKGKAITLEAITDPEGSRRLRPPDFKIIGT